MEAAQRALGAGGSGPGSKERHTGPGAALARPAGGSRSRDPQPNPPRGHRAALPAPPSGPLPAPAPGARPPPLDAPVYFYSSPGALASPGRSATNTITRQEKRNEVAEINARHRNRRKSHFRSCNPDG